MFCERLYCQYAASGITLNVANVIPVTGRLAAQGGWLIIKRMTLCARAIGLHNGLLSIVKHNEVWQQTAMRWDLRSRLPPIGVT